MPHNPVHGSSVTLAAPTPVCLPMRPVYFALIHCRLPAKVGICKSAFNHSVVRRINSLTLFCASQVLLASFRVYSTLNRKCASSLSSSGFQASKPCDRGLFRFHETHGSSCFRFYCRLIHSPRLWSGQTACKWRTPAVYQTDMLFCVCCRYISEQLTSSAEASTVAEETFGSIRTVPPCGVVRLRVRPLQFQVVLTF